MRLWPSFLMAPPRERREWDVHNVLHVVANAALIRAERHFPRAGVAMRVETMLGGLELRDPRYTRGASAPVATIALSVEDTRQLLDRDGFERWCVEVLPDRLNDAMRAAGVYVPRYGSIW